MAENTPINQEQKGSGKKIVIIIAILLLIGLNAFQAWWKYDTDQKNIATIELKDNSIAEQQSKLDSMIIVIDQQIAEAEELGLEIEGLQATKDEMEAELKKTKNWAYSLNGQKKRLTAKVSAYEKMLKQMEVDLAEAKRVNEELNAENTVLKEAVVERNDTINNLQTKKSELEETVAKAQILRASEFNVIGINKKGKQKEAAIYKAKWLDLIKVEFKLDPNKVAILDSKEVFLVVKNTSGTTIYDDTSGGGTFEFEGNEIYYSVKQDVQYVREGQQVDFTFKNPNLYTAGKQTIEIYCEGSLIGSSTFAIK